MDKAEISSIIEDLINKSVEELKEDLRSYIDDRVNKAVEEFKNEVGTLGDELNDICSRISDLDDKVNAATGEYGSLDDIYSSIYDLDNKIEEIAKDLR